MQRQILNGVPYYIDGSKKLYTYTEQPIHIGSLSTDGSVAINSGIYTVLDNEVAKWRLEQSSRTRKPQEKSTKDSKDNKDA